MFYGQGKSRLAPAYETLFVWSQERNQDHMSKFLQFSPSLASKYKKLSNSGLPLVKRKRRSYDLAKLFQSNRGNEDGVAENSNVPSEKTRIWII